MRASGVGTSLATPCTQRTANPACCYSACTPALAAEAQTLHVLGVGRTCMHVTYRLLDIICALCKKAYQYHLLSTLPVPF